MSVMKQVKRFDLSEIGQAEITDQGFMKVPGFATRIGVFTYRTPDGSIRRELRHPDDVFDPASLATLKNVPVTLEHPPEMVNPGNIDNYIKGYCTEKIGVNRDLVEAELIITHQAAISAINDGIRELSSGYIADLEEESGVYNGAPYDYRQRNIKYNHLALVKKGRAGPEVRLRLDSEDAIMHNDGEPMELKKVKIGDYECEMPMGAAMIVEDMFDRYDEMKAKGAEMEKMKEDGVDLDKPVDASIPDKEMAPDGASVGSKTSPSDTSGPAKAAGMDKEEDKKEEMKEDKDPEGSAMSPSEELKMVMKEKEDMQKKMDKMQAKLDEYASKTMNKKMDAADSEDFNAAVKKRVKLIKSASAVCSKEAVEKLDSLSEDEIRIEAIKAVHPRFDGEGKSSVYLEARFDSVMETIDVAERMRKGTYDAKRAEKYDAVDSNEAKERSRAASKDMWKEDLSAVKK